MNPRTKPVITCTPPVLSSGGCEGWARWKQLHQWTGGCCIDRFIIAYDAEVAATASMDRIIRAR